MKFFLFITKQELLLDKLSELIEVDNKVVLTPCVLCNFASCSGNPLRAVSELLTQWARQRRPLGKATLLSIFFALLLRIANKSKKYF